MQNPASILENEMHTIFCDFMIQTDHQISVRRPDLVIVKKRKKNEKTCWIVEFAVPADHKAKLKKKNGKEG